MAKLVVRSLKTQKRAKARKSAIKIRRVKDAKGRVRTVRVLDANSASFGDDLLAVFKTNVARARKANKRAVGSADLAPGKS